MNPPAPVPKLPAEPLEMMRRGVSVIVASCNAGRHPSIMRAVGSQITEDGAGVTVFVARSQSQTLLDDLAATGAIAVVFSEPATHRTVQVKARQVHMRPATAADQPALARYLMSMQHEVGRVGLGPAFTKAMLAHRIDDLVALSFAPDEAYDQTPGAHAGAPVGDAR